MKFFASLLVAAVAVSAVAIPDADTDAVRQCHEPNQPCWKVKRAAEAFPTISGEDHREMSERFPTTPIGSVKARRQIDELANLVAAAQEDPSEYYEKLGIEKRSAEDTVPLAPREAMPAHKCRKPGQACWKRDVEADADVHAEDERRCREPGQLCWAAKRAAEALIETIGNPAEDASPLVRREVTPEAEAARRECREPGQVCWKALRDLHEISKLARAVIDSLA